MTNDFLKKSKIKGTSCLVFMKNLMSCIHKISFLLFQQPHCCRMSLHIVHICTMSRPR